MLSEVDQEPPGPRDCDVDCIVMYGGGLTSYEVAKRAIDRFGHESVEIWFADTRTEDEDLYRFNRDVESILNHNIVVFSQGLDIWEIFERERFLGNSRIDPCSKFLKRVPLRKELERRYSDWACVTCKEKWHRSEGTYISVRDIDGTEIREPLCNSCLESDERYRTNHSELLNLIEEYGDDCIKSRIGIRGIAGRVERCSPEIRFPRVVLGMNLTEDCDRLHRAKSYWRPFLNWFPLGDRPFVNKTQIIEDLRGLGVKEPRLYGEGFEHNNCGGFCVKAGRGQMVHLLKTLPDRYMYHERKEIEFQEFIGSDVTILTETRNHEKRNLSLKELRMRSEAGEEFKFDKSRACACLNPTSPEADEVAW